VSISPDTLKDLRGRWDRCFLDLSLEPPGDVFDALVERYSEAHRAYHTLQHIAECFDQFDHVRDAESPGTVGLALWFHDAVYDTRAHDNEAESARYAHNVSAKRVVRKRPLRPWNE